MGGFKDKDPQIQGFLDDMAARQFGMKVSDALEKGVCVKCHLDHHNRCPTQLDVTEYLISGLCGVCWGEIVGTIPEEGEDSDDSGMERNRVGEE